MNTKIYGQHPWTWLIVMLTALLLTACGGGSGSGGGTPPPPPTPISISSTSPADKTAGVALNTAIGVTFSAKVEPATIVSPASAFTVKEVLSGKNVEGSVIRDASGMTAVFTPAANLAANTQYLGTVTTAVKNTDGTALARDYTWTFTTTSPAVDSTSLASVAAAPAINTKVAATFNTDMNPATIVSPATSFTLKPSAPGGTAVAGTVSYDSPSRTAIFAPAANLQPATTYIATLTTDAKDTRGNALTSNTTWTFTTGSQSDTVVPTVFDFSPGHEVKGVELNSQIKVTFAKPMDPSTITLGSATTSPTFLVSDANSNHLSGTLAIDTKNNVATFFPADLKPNTRYHIVVTNGAKDLAGNAFGVDGFVSFFETGAR
jgi:hypothetical protein